MASIQNCLCQPPSCSHVAPAVTSCTSTAHSLFDSLYFEDLSQALTIEKAENIRSHILSQLTAISHKLTTVGKASIRPPSQEKDWICKLRIRPQVESYVRILFRVTNGRTIEKLVYLSGGSRGVFMYKKAKQKCETWNIFLKREKDKILFYEYVLSKKLGSNPYVLQEEAIKRRRGLLLKGFKAPWCVEGDIVQYMEKERHHPFPLTKAHVLEKLKIGSQAAAGLAYIHSQGFVHGDINPSNICLQNTPEGIVAKIMDFDRTMSSGWAWKLPVISRSYTPPEAWAVHRPISRKDDIWSFGLTLVELFDGFDMNLFLYSRDTKIEDRDFEDIKKYLVIRAKWIQLHDQIIKNANEWGVLCPFIYTLIDLDPSKRPEASEIAARLNAECIA